MPLSGKCDICQAFVEEGQGYVCKCMFTDVVCARCAGGGVNKCGICSGYYEHVSRRKGPKK